MDYSSQVIFWLVRRIETSLSNRLMMENVTRLKVEIVLSHADVDSVNSQQVFY